MFVKIACYLIDEYTDIDIELMSPHYTANIYVAFANLSIITIVQKLNSNLSCAGSMESVSSQHNMSRSIQAQIQQAKALAKVTHHACVLHHQCITSSSLHRTR